MSEILSVDCELREKCGKGEARTLRKNSRVPINIYGKGIKNISASISAKSALEICHRFTAKTSVVEIKLGKDKHLVLPKEISLHPVTDEITHVSFLQINAVEQLKIDIPIKIEGRSASPGIKRGGVVNMTTRFLTSKVKKDKIPAFITVDISNMSIGDTLRLEDLKIPSEITTLEKDSKKTIIKLVGKRAKASVEETTETEEETEAEANSDTKES